MLPFRAISLLFLTELSCLCVSERVKKTNVIECKKSDPIPRIESWNTHGFQLEKLGFKKKTISINKVRLLLKEN